MNWGAPCVAGVPHVSPFLRDMGERDLVLRDLGCETWDPTGGATLRMVVRGFGPDLRFCQHGTNPEAPGSLGVSKVKKHGVPHFSPLLREVGQSIFTCSGLVPDLGHPPAQSKCATSGQHLTCHPERSN
jgi:hypothetical protein